MSSRQDDFSGDNKLATNKALTSSVDDNPHATKLEHNSYTVGWICALPKEQTAATAMLDKIHPHLPKPPSDPNTYTLGCIGRHNIVIACLPKGQYGTNSASAVATRMVSTFPSIKVGLLVGIGGGIPPKVRLGDVVVGTPVDQCSGVVQWDLGKAEAEGGFKRTGVLNNPPTALLTALTKLETMHEMSGPKIYQYLDDMGQRWPKLMPKYTRCDSLVDPLFDSDNCARESQHGEGHVHYGLIASGNQVIKDAHFRDSLNKSLGGNVLCVEMEAAGLMNNFPCVVIRGICDYADSQKTKAWQEYAAAVAAAYAKELLEYVQSSDVDGERPVKDMLDDGPIVLESVSRTETNVETMKSKFDRKEELEVLEWLTPIDYGPQHSDFLKRRQSGTAQWFLDSTIYQTWISSNKQTLFCPGIPGAGKTILTAAVIDDITARFLNDKSVGIAYVYCDFRRQNEQSAEDLITSLLKQLSQCRPSLPDIVRSLYDRHRHRRTRPELDEISTTLRSVGAMYSRVFIIIDALDECQTSNDCRTRFITESLNFQATCGGNILATSRFIPQITEKFKKCMTLEIRAHDQDVQKYLRSRILQCESRLLASHSEEIQTEITKAVDGMFLLAQLHFDAGSEAYNDAYEDVMQRIEGQDIDSRKLAHDALSWINCVMRPLNTLELRHALAVEAETEFDRDNIPFLDDIISVCAGLVTVDEESDVIRLVHYTAQEFFQRTWTRWFSNAHHGIATACVTYLSFDPFKTGPCSTDMDFEARLDAYPLFSYAARNWGHHVRAQEMEISLIVALLEDTPRLNACVQGLFARKEFSTHWNYSQQVPKLFTGLHLASYFGLENVVLYMIQQGKQSEVIDSFGRLPLTWAAFNGHVGVVQHLLGRSINSDSADNDGRTPLAWAACNDHERVVKLLVEKGLGLGSRDTFGRTPLSLAASNGCVGVVKLLVEIGSDLNSRDADDRTPLSWAAYKGHTTIVQLLLEGGVDPDSKDVDGRTPISWAAYNGCEAVVQILLVHCADPDSKDETGRTPLSWAAENGHERVVKLLLKKGVEVTSIDQTGRTPLDWASYYGHKTVVELLLSKIPHRHPHALSATGRAAVKQGDCENNEPRNSGSYAHTPSATWSDDHEVRGQDQQKQPLREPSLESAGTFTTNGDSQRRPLSPEIASPHTVPSLHSKWYCRLCPEKDRLYTERELRRHIRYTHAVQFHYYCTDPHCPDAIARNPIANRFDHVRHHYTTKHGRWASKQEIYQSEQEEPHPRFCLICDTSVRSWREFYDCVTRHCQGPRSSTVSDEQSAAGSPKTESIKDEPGRSLTAPKLSHDEHALQDLQMQLMLLEQQKRRLSKET
ncbi:hypothetical protein AnigIFM50267_001157 [Aspergillus niger]|nr:hypothetical protein AnigIFM50267_001157 [Aspergillus niger]